MAADRWNADARRQGFELVKRLAFAIAAVVTIAACSGAGAADAPTTETGPVTSEVPSAGENAADTTPTTPIIPLDYPDAALRAFWRAMREPRPVENSAMPPRHLNEDFFPDLLVDREEIVAGGPPPDGIPSIDDPQFSPVADVDDLQPEEAVLVLEHETEVRIYPTRIMIWHEIVNDVVGDTPITVTYCPLCNSAIGYERELGDQTLDFGTSGYLFRSGLVMYDRQTESLWTHFDGRAVVGTLMGEQLSFLPVATVSWAQASEAHPDALVLGPSVDDPKPYGRNRYAGYDQIERPLRGWFNIEIPEPVPPMTRVVGVRTSEGSVAIPTSTVAEESVVEASLGVLDFVVFWVPGTASPLQRDKVADGDDIGATGVFDRSLDGRQPSFVPSGDGFGDIETGSTWNVLGQAVEGPVAGSTLRRVQHLDTFWFAWVGYHSETELFSAT